MERYYRLNLPRRLVNVLVRPLVRLGIVLRHTYILTVPGRKSGRRYSTPVTLVEDGGRWLVAPYGERNWVKNARAAGWVELSRAGRTERVRVTPVDMEEAAPVLRAYVRAVPSTRRFFTAHPSAPVAEFAAEASRHPVFRVESAAGTSANSATGAARSSHMVGPSPTDPAATPSRSGTADPTSPPTPPTATTAPLRPGSEPYRPALGSAYQPEFTRPSAARSTSFGAIPGTSKNAG